MNRLGKTFLLRTVDIMRRFDLGAEQFSVCFGFIYLRQGFA